MPEFELKIPTNREFVGGDLVAQTLASFGVEVAFGLHGGHLDTFLVGCSSVGIRLVDTRHETTAVQAAEGYAKLKGQVGVCFVTANSGFSNAFPGLATAFADRSPVFVVTSSAPLRDAETNCLQGCHDQVVLAKPVTKFCHRVTVVEEIPRIMAHAWRMATTGAPGPVLIDFPIDVLSTPPQIGRISYGSANFANTFTPPFPSPSALTELLGLWKSAQRPVIITGTGAARTNGDGTGDSPLLQLAELTKTPLFYSMKFSPNIPHEHPLRGGPAFNLAYLPAIGQPQADLVILLGARPGALLAGRSGAIIPKNCKLVHIDTDASELGRMLPVELGIVSDATEFVNATLALLRAESDLSFERGAGWAEAPAALKQIVHQRYQGDAKQRVAKHGGEECMHPYHAINTLFDSLKEHHPIVITDGGESNIWGQDLMESAQAMHSMSATGYLGFLGNGFGYAMGAAVACPDKLIINLQGDGSAGFHIAELDTYARHNLRILTVVANNYKWGMSISGQDLIYGEEEKARPVSSLSPVCRFDIVAEGFGCVGRKCTKVDEIPAVASELAQAVAGGQFGRAGLVNLIIDVEPVTEMTKAMVAVPASKENVIRVPYYDDIPRPFYRD